MAEHGSPPAPIGGSRTSWGAPGRHLTPRGSALPAAPAGGAGGGTRRVDDGPVPEARPGGYAGGGVKTPKWLPAGSCRSAKTSPSLLVVGGTITFPPSRSTWAQTAATSWTTTMKIAWFGNSPPVSKIPPLGASAPG